MARVRIGPPPHAARLPRALVVRDPEPEEIGVGIDWSDWYLDDDSEGEHGDREQITQVLLSVIAQLARERGLTDFDAGTGRFFAWVREEPLVRVSPDVYLLDHRPAPPLPKQWQTWLPGHHPPRFALEIVATDWRKDYEDIPLKYWQLRCPELVLFDPLADAEATWPSIGRVQLQTYRRDADGAYVRTHAGPGPIYCAALDAWLVVQGSPPRSRLRLSRSARAHELVPTEDEVVRAEIRARDVAEARVRELEARLRELEQLDLDDRDTPVAPRSR